MRGGRAKVLWRMLLLVVAGAVGATFSRAEELSRSSEGRNIGRFVTRYCVDCHNGKEKTAGLDLDGVGSQGVGEHAKVWESVVRKLIGRQMPPWDSARPKEAEYDSAVSVLEAALDSAATAQPNPGRTESIRRLNRTEYQNAIRDLLALAIDATALLPNDEVSHGFDNVTVSNLSPTLMDRYITAAQKIARLALGSTQRSASGETFRIRADQTQEEQAEDLPIGTRGGASFAYTFPQDGDYDVQIWLTRDRNEHVEGLTEPHELEVLLDRRRMELFTVTPPSSPEGHQTADAKLKTRITVAAGPHKLGITFLKEPTSLLETKRQPYQAHFNMHRHPRVTPAIYQVSITGPFEAKGHGDTPSRRRILICEPTSAVEEEDCAKRILLSLERRAYRRPVTEADLEGPMKFYREARVEGDFDAGIEMALSAILVNPQFLFRVERDPPDAAPKTAYRISDVELASRLSFFLWSSIPDDELLDLAERNELRKPEVYQRQMRRMLADERARNLATNFAGQWLYLRNLESIIPDVRQFPDFDDNLRQAFRQETELFFESILRGDRSVLELLRSKYAFLNERLAKHYGIEHVYGSRFRKVALADNSVRGGLLRQGSVLTVTSYATRTSPVIRGKWVLENILGSPPPPPLPNVPSLKDNTVSSNLSVRERLAEHRANPACASCHSKIDPVGFSLEQFDAVGRWRTLEEGKPVDATGGLPDGSKFVGVAGLEQALLDRPEIFVGTLTEKLMTFALGREVEYFDAPAIRKILRDAKAENYSLSALVMGIATSTPFQMRMPE